MNIEDVLKGHGIGIGGSNIKSIQRGTTTLGSTGLSLNITISAININNSIIRVTYYNPNQSGSDYTLVKAEILDSTTIKLSRGTTQIYYPVIVYWEVIEFNNVKSKQSGNMNLTFDGSNTFKTVTVSSINTQKSLLFYSLNTTTAVNNVTGMIFCGVIDTATSLKFLITFSATYNINWQVIEFN